MTDGAVPHADPADRDDRAPVLVLGVGSDLRRDDAAGRRVAEAIAALELPGVQALSVHQLAPELAMQIADRRLVIVVDASIEEREGWVEDRDEVVVSAVDTIDAAGAMSHHLDVRGLLGLASMVASAPQEVRTVAVPAHDLGIGTELSPTTRAHVREAVRRVIALCDEVTSR